MKDRSRSRIPAEESSEFVRWTLPDVSGKSTPNVSVEEGQMEVKPMTADELEAIRKEAFEAGYQDGRKEGEEQGYQDGLLKGGEEGKVRGFEKGLDEGHEQGRNEKVSEINASQERLSLLMESLLYPIKIQQDHTEEALLNLVLAVSRAVIQRELTISSDQIIDVIHEAISLLPDTEGKIHFHLNPVDAPTVREIISVFSSSAKLTENPEIMAGGCRIETSESIVDATIEKRFQKVVQSLLKQSLSPKSDTVDLTDNIDDMSGFQRELLETDVAVDEDTTATDVSVNGMEDGEYKEDVEHKEDGEDELNVDVENEEQSELESDDANPG